MKKIAFLFLPFALALAAGCSQIEQDIPVIPADEGEILVPKSFQAGVAETRTTLDGVTVLFAKDESISIWDGSGNREYKADDAGANVSFSGEVSATATEFFALSPYSAATVFSRDGSTVTAKTTLPSMQEAVPGTFASGMNISAAKSALQLAQRARCWVTLRLQDSERRLSIASSMSSCTSWQFMALFHPV